MREILLCWSDNKKLINNKAYAFLENLYSDPNLLLQKDYNNFEVLGISNISKLNLIEDYFSRLSKDPGLIIIGTSYPANNDISILHNLSKKEFIADDLIPELCKLDSEFLIIRIDIEKNEVIIINSKLGLIPCYYLIKSDTVVISTRLALIKCIYPNLEIDQGLLSQHCFYNYPISNKTIYKDVHLLASASLMTIEIKSAKQSKYEYWNIEQDLLSSPLGFKDSIDLMDSTMDTIIKEKIHGKNIVGLSLTGGWDGRLILAYASKYLDSAQLLLYSFGTPNAPDVIIPKKIAKVLGYNYLHIDLNQTKYESELSNWAVQTILNSDGWRSLKRAHYLFAMELLNDKVDCILTGIGGSNLVKSAYFSPSTVFNKHVLELIYSDDYISVINKHYDIIKTKYGSLFPNLTRDDFLNSFEDEEVQNLFSCFSSPHKRMVSFLITNIERKYFGPELLSYRHIDKSYSPFFDMRFIRSLMKTCLFGAYNSDNSVRNMYRNALFYAKMVNKNNSVLAKHITDRGFALSDLLFPWSPRLIYGYLKARQDRKLNVNFFNNNDLQRTICKNLSQDSQDRLKSFSDDSFISNYTSMKLFIEN